MKKIKLSSIKPNPENPRIIKDEKFAKLKKSIESFPQMMQLRPIVIDEKCAGMYKGDKITIAERQQQAQEV